MKVIKKINNNIAICVDDDKNELVAFGLGIGFPKMPYELYDLSKIDRTYYEVNPSYFSLLNEIPDYIFDITEKIINYAKKLIPNEFNPNLIFTLSDHIYFATQRNKDHVIMQMPLSQDIQHLYENEFLVGEKAVEFINKEMTLSLSKDEVIGIAIHIINAEKSTQEQLKTENLSDEEIIEQIIKIIESDFNFVIDKKGLNYSRFSSHIHYLLKRKHENISNHSINNKLFDDSRKYYAESFLCAEHIAEYLQVVFNWELSNEELLYLMIHINRLCSVL